MCSYENKLRLVGQLTFKQLAFGEITVQGLIDLLQDNTLLKQYAAELRGILLEVVRNGIKESKINISCASLSDTTMVSLAKQKS